MVMKASSGLAWSLRFELLANDVDRCTWSVRRDKVNRRVVLRRRAQTRTPIISRPDDLCRAGPRNRGVWSGECAVLVYSCPVYATDDFV